MGRRANYWAKIWVELLDDPVVGMLPDRLWRRMIELFLIAKTVPGETGELPPVENMAWKLRTTPERLHSELSGIEELTSGENRAPVVQQTPDGWFVTNFAKRQSATGSAERQRRYRARKKRKETEPEKKQNTEVYQNVTRGVTASQITLQNETGTVTNRNAPETDAAAIDVVLAAVDRWLQITGGVMPDSAESRRHDYFVPINRLLIRVGWDVERAVEMLASARASMLERGLTPYRPAAVVPVAFAELDKPTGAAPESESDRIDRIMRLAMEN